MTNPQKFRPPKRKCFTVHFSNKNNMFKGSPGLDAAFLWCDRNPFINCPSLSKDYYNTCPWVKDVPGGMSDFLP